MYMFRGKSAIEFESTLERDFIIRKEFSLAVLDVVPQPCRIHYADPRTGCLRRYIPDFLVYYRRDPEHCGSHPKPVLVEVKPGAEWRRHWREWLPKWKAAGRFAREQGWTFHIQDETRIRDQALENILFLGRYKRMAFPVEDCAILLETVRAIGKVSIAHLIARHLVGICRAEGIALLWHLLAVRKIDCEISRPLGDSTEVWIPEHA